MLFYANIFKFLLIIFTNSKPTHIFSSCENQKWIQETFTKTYTFQGKHVAINRKYRFAPDMHYMEWFSNHIGSIVNFRVHEVSNYNQVIIDIECTL